MKRVNLGVKPLLIPQPVVVIASYDEEYKADAMTAAWVGVLEEDELIISLSADHKSTKNILNRKALTLSIGTKEYVKECDFVGIFSQNIISDKLDKAGLTTTKSEFVDAPIINELPLCLECVLDRVIENSYYVAKIVNVSCKEEILDKKTNIDLKKLEPLIFDISNAKYHIVGDEVGKAFNDGTLLVEEKLKKEG